MPPRSIRHEGVKYLPTNTVIRYTIRTEVEGLGAMPPDLLEMIAETPNQAIALMTRTVDANITDEHYLWVSQAFNGGWRGDNTSNVVFEWMLYKKSDVDEAIEWGERRGD